MMFVNPAWWWVAFAFLLLIIEMLTGTTFFLWLAPAALVAAVAAWLTGGLAVQLVTFSVAAVVALFGWQRYRPVHDKMDQGNVLNRRSAACLGRVVVLAEPIRGGRGRVNIDDAWWTVSGDDAEAGSRVKVTGAEGMILRVEKEGN